jgi:hypothetical protein
MKIQYYFEEEKIYENEQDAVPVTEQMIFIEEIFYVDNVVWYPKLGVVRVYLVDELKVQKTTVSESAKSEVNPNDVKKAQATADKALKESTNLKRQLFSIRQYLKTKPGGNSPT